MGGAVAFADTRPRHPHKIPVAPVARRVVVDPPGHSFVPEGPPTLGAIHRRRLALSTWRAWSFPPAPYRASRPPPGWPPQRAAWLAHAELHDRRLTGARVSFHWGRWRAAGGLHMTPPHGRQLAGRRHLRIFHAAPIRSARAAGRADRREPGERIGEDQRTDRRAAGPPDRRGPAGQIGRQIGEDGGACLAPQHDNKIGWAGRSAAGFTPAGRIIRRTSGRMSLSSFLARLLDNGRR